VGTCGDGRRDVYWPRFGFGFFSTVFGADPHRRHLAARLTLPRNNERADAHLHGRQDHAHLTRR
jgi:hypothetical protein